MSTRACTATRSRLHRLRLLPAIALVLLFVGISAAYAAPPITGDDTALAVTGQTLAGASVLGNDFDPDDDILTAQMQTTTSHGTLIFSPVDGTYTYTPADGFSGTDSFTYTAFDGTTHVTATVVITVVGDVYVATPANGGSDTAGDGSLAVPYATMAKAMAGIGTGFTLHVGAGEFECVTLSVKDDVSIVGAGASATTLTANAKGRVLIYNGTGVGGSLSDVTITGGAGNAYGGGLYLFASSPTITDCVITGNSTTGSGGGIWCQSGAAPTLTGCTLSNNTAASTGGAIYLQNPGTVVTITESTFFSNSAINAGGALFAQNGALLAIDSCEFDANYTEHLGGAVYMEDPGTSASIHGSTFMSNAAGADGGAVLIQGAAVLDITSCALASNTAGNRGAGICLEDAGTSAAITACTITSNSATGWGGGVASHLSATTTIANSIVWGNTASSSPEGTGFTAAFSDIRYGYAGTGNIDADPLFRDPAAGDYRLTGSSPAIDEADPAVSPATDLLGVTRPQGIGVDMGAYEYVPLGRADAIVTNEDGKVAFNVLANDDPAGSALQQRTAVKFSKVSTGTLEYLPSGEVTYTPPANWNGVASFTYVADYETMQSAPVTVEITVNAVNDAPKAIADGELAQLQRFGAWNSPIWEVWGYGGGTAIQGDTAVVVSFAAMGVVPDGICVYQRTGGVWRLLQTFPSGPGMAVVLDGDTFVAGVPDSDLVHVYHRDAQGVWALQQTIADSLPGNLDKFGYHLDLDGDTLVVGASHSNRWVKVGTSWVRPSGSAYIYTRSGGVWTQRAELKASTEAAYDDFFGMGVAVEGDTIMVGTVFRGVWAFTRTGADWSSYDAAKLPVPAAERNSYGQGIDIEGDTAIVGSVGGPLILNRTPAGWIQTQRLDPFGDGYVTVALDGDTGLVTSGYFGGYVIRRTTAGWVRSGTIPSIPDGMYFGRTGDISDGTILMGDPLLQNADFRYGTSFFIDGVLYSATEDTPLVIDTARGVLHNDTDIEGDPLTAELVDTSDLHGTLALDPDGGFTYTPAANFNGTAKATYRVSDDNGGSSIAAITISVDAVNDAPVAVDDAVTTAEDTVARFNVLDNDSDTDVPHSALTAVNFSEPTTGTIETLPSGEVAFTPPADWSGEASFTYEVDDGIAPAVQATVRITVTASGDAPVARDDDAGITAEDTPLTVPAAAGVLANDTDIEGDALTPSLVDAANLHGTLVFSAGGGFTYTPARDYVGTASATYRVSDGTAYSAPATITFNVTPVNDAPVAVGDAVPCIQNGYETFNVLANDIDVDSPRSSLAAVSFTTPAIGQIQTSPTGLVTYTPPADFLGKTSFTYRLTDGELVSAPVTVNVTVSRAVISRIGGVDRFDAAANIARRGWDRYATKEWAGVTDVIIANGEVGKEADPLCAAGLAGIYDAPILLIQSRRVPASTLQALTEIAAKNPGVRIHLVGGTASVPDARWQEIKGVPGVDPARDRIGGSDRYVVSAGIAKRMIEVKGAAAIPAVLLVAGDNTEAFYDGLAAGPIAYAKTMPLLAVRKNSLAPPATALLKGALAHKKRYAVSSSTYIGKVPAKGATRLTTSNDRYKAASQIAYAALAHNWLSAAEAGVTAKLPDALTGGAFLGKHDGVLLFTDSDDSMQPITQSYLAAHKGRIHYGWILGGTGSVTKAQEATFRELLR